MQQRIHIQIIENYYETITKREKTDRKWTKYLNKQFTKVNIQITNNHMKRCLDSVSSREYKLNHIQYISTGIAKKKKAENVKYWRGSSTTGTLIHFWCKYLQQHCKSNLSTKSEHTHHVT